LLQLTTRIFRNFDFPAHLRTEWSLGMVAAWKAPRAACLVVSLIPSTYALNVHRSDSDAGVAAVAQVNTTSARESGYASMIGNPSYPWVQSNGAIQGVKALFYTSGVTIEECASMCSAATNVVIDLDGGYNVGALGSVHPLTQTTGACGFFQFGNGLCWGCDNSVLSQGCSSTNPSGQGLCTEWRTSQSSYGLYTVGQTSSATGDPHLVNIHGERFDLARQGKAVLINVPRGKPAEDALLVVVADVRRLGGHCADMYFQRLNITGAWADETHAGGLTFDVQTALETRADWAKFGPLELKVVHGHTEKGIPYLNFFVKHLHAAGFAVGGLLGEDDHSEVAMPEHECQKSVALSVSKAGSDGHLATASVAVAIPA